MKKKLINKHLLGNTLTPAWTTDTFDNLPNRKYYWKQWTPEMKVKTDYRTGEPLNEEWKVLVDDLGNIVDTTSPQVLADYAALSGSNNFKVEHPGVTFTFYKDTKQKFVLPTSETADERKERLSNAPIATDKLWEKIKLQEEEERFGLTPEGHKIYLNQKDKEAKAKTPGAGMLFAAPLALGAGTAIALSNPLAFLASLGGAKIGEATLNYPFLQQGYKSFGDWLFEGTNTPDWIKSGSNVGTLLGGGAGWSLANKYLVTTKNLLKHTTLDALKKSILSNYYNLVPKLVEDAVATEISSYTPRSIIKLPAVLFSKTGDINKGSLISKVKDNINNFFGNDPVWNFMERTGIPEEQRAVVEKVLIKSSLDPNKNWYTDPWSNITYAIKTPQATDKELISQFASGLTSRFKLYKTDPLLKAAIQQEMGWDNATYNNFLKEITKKMLEENSIGISGKEELSGNLAQTIHLKIENPELATRYATLYLINRDRIAGESSNIAQELQYAKEAGTHEGYHGITSGINGETDAVEKGIQNEYPLMTSLMERNKKFLLNVAETLEWYNYFNNTPVYKVVSDLKASGFTPEQIEYITEFSLPRAKSYNRYVLEPQETSARDVVATTLGPGTKNEELLRNIYTPESFNKFHGKLFSKTGDINEGSLTGTGRNWQIRALAPGNPLSKRVSPDGTISWKNLNWYLDKGNISPSDRIIIEQATRHLPKDLPINYLNLLLRTNEYIPKYTTRKETEWANYGLDRLGYGRIEDSDGFFSEPSISLDSGITPLAYSFHSHVGGNSRHYNNAIGHYRTFTNEKEPNILYITENQSDWAQQGLKNNEFLPSGVLRHIAETYQERQLLEILLRAYNLGKTKVRFPTSETSAKVEGFSKSYIDNNSEEILKRYLYLWEDEIDNLIESKYPEEGKKLKIKHAVAREKSAAISRIIELLNLLFRLDALPQFLNFSLDTFRLLLSPEDYIERLKTRLSPELLETDLFKEIQENVEKLKSLRTKGEIDLPFIFKKFEDKTDNPPKWKTDPEILELIQRKKLIILNIRQQVSDYSPGQKGILSKYNAFPKRFRRLFGDKADVRVVSDAKNNQWYEIDIPKDMNTRKLIFGKIGEGNEGSLIGASKGHWLVRALLPGNLLEKRLSPDGTVSWKNFNWYINSLNISRFDKLHLLRASIFLDHNKPINYKDLQKTSLLLIPTFDRKFTNNYSLYGLLLTGYMLDEVNSNPTLLLTHPVIRGDRAHFNDPTVFGHLRSFSTKNEPDVIHFLESQSDRSLHILNKKASDMETLTSNEVHMAETFPLRNIQEGLLFGYDNGFTSARFPTGDTSAKIEGFSKHITREGLSQLNKLLGTFKDIQLEFYKEYYPDIYKVEVQYRKSLENTKKLEKLSGDLISKFHLSSYNIDGEFLQPWESPYEHINLLDFLILIAKSPEHKKELENIQKTLKEFIASREETINLYEKRLDLEEEFLDEDPYYQSLEDLYHEDYLALKEMYSRYPKGQLLIMSRYDAFPKHFRSLFGNKNEVRNITDVKGNTWYEVDIPSDMPNRNLLFSKIGEVNKGSTVGASRRPILRKNMHKFSDSEWDAAYEAALEKGNKREMWRLLTLRFLLKAREYIANGGDPKVLYRGDWRDFLNFKKEGVWLSSDPEYALNFTEDRIAKDKVFYPSKVHKYFVKGTSEKLLPKAAYKELTKDAIRDEYYWGPITSHLMFGVPNEFRRFAKINNSGNRLLKLFGKAPKELTAVLKKAHRLGSADVIVGEDSPVSGIVGYEYWHPSLGLEYYVSNPNYVKSANLITYDDNGRMIPLSLRFNFSRNDKRYSWLLPLLPFLSLSEKD